MKLLQRLVMAALLAAGTLSAVPSPEAAADTMDNGANSREDVGCACETLGQGACQHFLRNPAGVTDDPCWCDKCRNGGTGKHHDGNTVPNGWNPTYFQSGTMEHYLKRHALAWGITCSACFASEKPWPDGSSGNMGTVPARDYAGRPAQSTVMDRLAREKRPFFKRGDQVVVAYDRHFYIATDVEGLKVRTPGGSGRLITTHEWAHLMIERAEFARREWVRNFGEPVMEKPIAMYFCDKQADQERCAAQYFGQALSKALTGSGERVTDGFCVSGLGFSHAKYGDDHELQVQMRHQLAHNILTCWGSRQVRPKSRPQWLEEGTAHWLTRTLKNFHDDATNCLGEGTTSGAIQITGKSWEQDILKLAAANKFEPIEKMLAVEVVNQLREEDHKRAWSMIDLCLKEWREPFVKLCAALRQQKDVREAFTANLGLTPEQFDDRWKERVLGRRKTMGPIEGETEEPEDAPGARDRRGIISEKDTPTLAAKLRQLGEIKDKKTMKVVVDQLARNNDLIRETALVTLLKTKEAECLQALWTCGLGHDDAIVRAYTARICGRLGLTGALPKLEDQLADQNWYARAEAAVACASMKDVKALAALRKMAASDAAEKARVGAMDALAMYGSDAGMAVPILAKQLEAGQWQLRVAAAEALGKIGSMEGVEPLLARMEIETGRVQDAIWESLRTISRDDLGRKPENWRKWWDHEKANAPDGKLPVRPEPPKEPKKADPNTRYAAQETPPAFGLEIYSNRVAFVCDTSSSMLTLFTPDPSAAKALSRQYVGRDKLTICKEEIAQAISSLDPRAHFNIVAFGTAIRAFKKNPVQANPGNVDQAVGFLQSLPGEGETNYYDALKVALDIGDEPDTNANFKATPDTITFLTDGLPTKGEVTDGDTLLEWYTGLNRYARVKTHTITFGLIGVDMPLLRSLAERNGGTFTIVPELRKR